MQEFMRLEFSVSPRRGLIFIDNINYKIYPTLKSAVADRISMNVCDQYSFATLISLSHDVARSK